MLVLKIGGKLFEEFMLPSIGSFDATFCLGFVMYYKMLYLCSVAFEIKGFGISTHMKDLEISIVKRLFFQVFRCK